MSDGFSAKNELKKALFSEPIKYAIGVLLATYTLPALALLFPAFRDLLFQSVPIWILLIVCLSLVSVIVVFGVFWSRTRQALKQMEAAQVLTTTRTVKARRVDPIAVPEYVPDDVDIVILRHIYHDRMGMEASLISQILGLSYGEADFRLNRLFKADFVEKPGWMVGDSEYKLTIKGKELIFALESKPGDQI